jgi:hypothetical protein
LGRKLPIAPASLDLDQCIDASIGSGPVLIHRDRWNAGTPLENGQSSANNLLRSKVLVHYSQLYTFREQRQYLNTRAFERRTGPTGPRTSVSAGMVAWQSRQNSRMSLRILPGEKRCYCADSVNSKRIACRCVAPK